MGIKKKTFILCDNLGRTFPFTQKKRSRHRVQEKIKSLERIGLEDADYAFLKSRINSLIDGYVVRAAKLPLGTFLFRGTTFDSCEKLPSNVSRLSYNPILDTITTYQRANPPNVSMFYGSKGREPIFYELRAETGTIVVISTWKIISEFWVNNVGGKEWLSPPAIDGTINSNIEKIDDTIYNFFSKCMAKKIDNNCEYKLTSAISENLMYGRSPTDQNLGGLVYPSVVSSTTAHNCVLTPETVKSCLRIHTVVAYRVVDRKEQSYEVEALNFAVRFEDDNIFWEKKPPDLLAPFKIQINNGEIKVTDMKGNPIPLG